jgi:GcrA cell cycle regulator
MLAQGCTGAQIAAGLGGGITRNAVIGKINRNHWRGPNVKSIRVKKPRAPRKPIIALRRIITPDIEQQQPELPPPSNCATISFSETGPKQLLELNERECKWPIGDPREPGFAFCAGERLAGFPYCAGHARAAFNHLR